MKYLLSLFLLVFSQTICAVEIKQLIVSGSGCEKKTLTNVKPVTGNEFHIPMSMSLIKRDNTNLERKVCMLAFAMSLGKKEKLQVSNVSQNVSLKAFGGAHLKLSLDVSAVGMKSIKPAEIEIKNPTSLDEDLKLEGTVVESKCGGNVMVKANVNSFVEGPGTASVTTGDLSMTIKTVACQKNN